MKKSSSHEGLGTRKGSSLAEQKQHGPTGYSVNRTSNGRSGSWIYFAVSRAHWGFLKGRWPDLWWIKLSLGLHISTDGSFITAEPWPKARESSWIPLAHLPSLGQETENQPRPHLMFPSVFKQRYTISHLDCCFFTDLSILSWLTP